MIEQFGQEEEIGWEEFLTLMANQMADKPTNEEFIETFYQLLGPDDNAVKEIDKERLTQLVKGEGLSDVQIEMLFAGMRKDPNSKGGITLTDFLQAMMPI